MARQHSHTKRRGDGTAIDKKDYPLRFNVYDYSSKFRNQTAVVLDDLVNHVFVENGGVMVSKEFIRKSYNLPSSSRVPNELSSLFGKFGMTNQKWTTDLWYKEGMHLLDSSIWDHEGIAEYIAVYKPSRKIADWHDILSTYVEKDPSKRRYERIFDAEREFLSIEDQSNAIFENLLFKVFDENGDRMVSEKFIHEAYNLSRYSGVTTRLQELMVRYGIVDRNVDCFKDGKRLNPAERWKWDEIHDHLEKWKWNYVLEHDRLIRKLVGRSNSELRFKFAAKTCD